VDATTASIPWTIAAPSGLSEAEGAGAWSVERDVLAQDGLGELGAFVADGGRDLVGADAERLLAQLPAPNVRFWQRERCR